MLLANNIGQLWDVYLATPGTELTTLGAWLGILAFSLQLYFDFSGYSDMAVGMGRMLGFQFLENFNYPYLAKSATEFWRRWHISWAAGSGSTCISPRGATAKAPGWCLTYSWYGPAPASGTGPAGTSSSGVWYYFVIIVFERFFFSSVLDKLPGWVGHVYGLFIVMVGWGAVRCGGLHRHGTLSQGNVWPGRDGLLDGTLSTICAAICPSLIIAILAATPLAKNLWAKLSTRRRQVAVPVLMLAGLALATAYLVDDLQPLPSASASDREVLT